jgi:SAM-dependent methyltransferase
MTDRSAWERFFDAHAPVYDGNSFTANTIEEVDFLVPELGLPPGGSVLDMGCGTGRHSIELARRGYDVTGVDLSAEMLALAAEAAGAAGVDVEWVRADATGFHSDRLFDGAICLCEGAFGLLGRDDDPLSHPLSILRRISACLKPGARLVLTALNGAAMLRSYSDEDVEEGLFDPVEMVETSNIRPREGREPLCVRQRGFLPTELRMLCAQAGLSVLHVWGGTAGGWRRRPMELDEIEVMVVAGKSDEPAGEACR